jgi:hypothetical protein
MGTRSTIAIQNTDGTVTGVYCHWDGGFWCNGPILQDHYQDEAKVRELISFGDMSSLNKRIHPTEGEVHNFDKNEAGVCVFYGRDRGETSVDAADFADWQTLMNEMGQEYNYLFVPGQGWLVEYHGAGWDRAQGPLAEEMAKEAETV